MEQDITNQITAVKVVARNFTNEQGQPVNYKQIILTGVLNGNKKEVVLKGVSSDKIELIEAFSPQDKHLLN